MKKSRFGSIETVKLALEFWTDVEDSETNKTPLTKFTVKELNNRTGNSLPTTTVNMRKLVQVGLVEKVRKNDKDSFYKASCLMVTSHLFEDIVRIIIEYENN